MNEQHLRQYAELFCHCRDIEVNQETGRYLGGDAIEFYRRLKGLGFKEAVRELSAQYGVADLPF